MWPVLALVCNIGASFVSTLLGGHFDVPSCVRCKTPRYRATRLFFYHKVSPGASLFGSLGDRAMVVYHGHQRLSGIFLVPILKLLGTTPTRVSLVIFVVILFSFPWPLPKAPQSHPSSLFHYTEYTILTINTARTKTFVY